MSNRLPVIALVGGPMAGKSSAEQAIIQTFGAKVVVVKEIATMLMGHGYPMPGVHVPYSERWLHTFQPLVVANQIGFEAGAAMIAEQSGARLMITDRGLMDVAVYLPGGLVEAEELLKANGLTIDEAFARYDEVIHLESLATANPELFGKTGNQTRYETLDQAVALEMRTREVWSRHPKWTFIPGTRGLAYVVSRVRSIVSGYVDREVERKFLLSAVPNIPLGEGIPIMQGYLVAEDAELRLRRIGGVNYIGVKNTEPRSRIAWQEFVPEHIFDLLWKRIVGTGITKTRYILPYGDLTLKLDVYEGSLSGLITLECVFADEERSLTFELPEWAADAIEVSDDRAYKNVSLALYGRPEISVS